MSSQQPSQLRESKKIILTGGGTAGHVTPNIALLPKLKASGWQVEYIGSANGIEKQLITDLGIPYHGIASGKLRRYFDLKNFTDPFKVIKGIFDAYCALKRLKPQVVFSKGGFVTVPVILASWLQRIPVIVHESDITPGLANKISLPLATQICVTFPETLKHLRKYSNRTVCTGLPIRQEILKGNPEIGRQLCEFSTELPVLFVVGGSTGSGKINQAIWSVLEVLTQKFQVVHVCGKNNLNPAFDRYKHYKQFEYLGSELADVLAIADVIVSRAGANSIFEWLALKKPHLLIPLSKAASRGDQILNAQSFQKQGYSAVLPEEDLNPENLLQSLDNLFENRQGYVDKMTESLVGDSISQIMILIDQV
ncbi:undecaprenyldiphospho-muramoylpentapeptide beta-N-acetylglucosaminyltransferase [Tumidithrix helvetica PCC 7403]|uniref:undecaprenyldiphospho-muramoylpentapeptide beta-N-acetylglucosaminyltransferase n=1 Tax=Tumidithrix helvetica TaxID=3457545 RepID=UPI003C9F7437